MNSFDWFHNRNDTEPSARRPLRTAPTADHTPDQTHHPKRPFVSPPTDTVSRDHPNLELASQNAELQRRNAEKDKKTASPQAQLDHAETRFR